MKNYSVFGKLRWLVVLLALVCSCGSASGLPGTAYKLKVALKGLTATPEGKKLDAEVRALPFVTTQWNALENWDVRLQFADAEHKNLILVRDDGTEIAESAVTGAAYKLRSALGREITRHLLRELENPQPDPQCKIELRIIPVEADAAGKHWARDRQEPSSAFQQGDYARVEVRNVGTKDAYVSIFDLPSDGAIAPIWPDPASAPNRVLADGKWLPVALPGGEYILYEMTAPLGKEVLKAVATEERTNLARLVDPQGDVRVKAGANPVERWLLEQLQLEGSGGDASPPQHWATAAIRFEVLPAPSLYVLSVGSNAAGSPHPLRFAEKDAQAIADTFKKGDRTRFKIGQVTALTGKNALRETILKTLSLLAQQMRPGDTLVFYYAGPTAALTEANGKKRVFLLPTGNAAPAKAAREGISVETMREMLRNIPARQRMVLLDTPSASAFGADLQKQLLAAESLLDRQVLIIEAKRNAAADTALQSSVFATALQSALKNSAVETTAQLQTAIAANIQQTEANQNLPDDNDPVVSSRGPEFLIAPDTDDPPAPGMPPRETGRGIALPVSHTDSPNGERTGKDYALLIGIEDYEHWPKLSNPVSDVRAVGAELEKDYGFSPDVLVNLTKNELALKLKEYAKRKYNDDDQLLIFIAGHGYYDEITRLGYTVTREAPQTDETCNAYYSHSDLRDLVDAISCKHILLILDVCFGGTFDRTVALEEDAQADFALPSRCFQPFSFQPAPPDISERAATMRLIQRKMKVMPSRLFLTSGGKDYVSDGIPGHHSPFAGKILKILQDNAHAADPLNYQKIADTVDRLNPEPRFGPFGTNRKNGDFLFIARKQP